ncbi:glycerate kinase [Brachybacterium vulturis]|uniref:Glycerate kinase n=1 Tax=Brachybacterium vulturis TaxID=2017484 RepID=A0A291GN20_9MICO|nr:glycerate kinase [Brachybacterium vulturis]ATG51608.1 glycerate kinase [Brachybacterium vulturis]
MTPTVLLAPDKFKGTLTAAQVVDALRRGIAQTTPQLRVLSCPIADGGDGTVDAAHAAGFTIRSTTVTGPTGAPRRARWALQEDVAVLELAETVGLDALPGGELAPHLASTRGLGELMRAAIDSGARTLLVGLGGSASTDAGAGLLQGLGAQLHAPDGTDLRPGLSGLGALASADLGPALAVLDGVTVIAANDVTNPLLGPEGAAAVYGPQKGLASAEITPADEVLAVAARILDPAGAHRDRPGAGAAGGTGFGLFLLGAAQRSGADAVFELVGVDALLTQADVVVTGEGKLDAQTLQGKGPAEVARRARERGLPVAAVAGVITLDAQELGRAGIDTAWDLTSRAGSTRRALEEGETLLVEIGRDLGPWLLEAAGEDTATGG